MIKREVLFLRAKRVAGALYTNASMRQWQALAAITCTLAIGTLIFVSLAEHPQMHNPGEVFTDCAECPELLLVPAGEFTMGSPPSEAGRFENEGPQRRVTIGYPLAVGRYEVTVAQFSQFLRETGYAMGTGCHHWTGEKWNFDAHYNWGAPGFPQGSSHPVVCVKWADARAYADWLSKKTDKSYRLLSESEWEYAARSGAASSRPWGGELSRDYANYGSDQCCQPFDKGSDQWKFTAPAGSFGSNRFGLYDMMGNVWEWVSDCWNENYADAPNDGSAWQSGDCGKRVIRGGSWFSDPRRLRSAVRYAFKGVNRTKVGFRICRDL